MKKLLLTTFFGLLSTLGLSSASITFTELSGLNYKPAFNQFSGYLQIPNSKKISIIG